MRVFLPLKWQNFKKKKKSKSGKKAKGKGSQNISKKFMRSWNKDCA